MVEAVVPFRGALSFFLGFWACLPDPIQLFVVAVFVFLLIVVVVRGILGH